MSRTNAPCFSRIFFHKYYILFLHIRSISQPSNFKQSKGFNCAWFIGLLMWARLSWTVLAPVITCCVVVQKTPFGSNMMGWKSLPQLDRSKLVFRLLYFFSRSTRSKILAPTVYIVNTDSQLQTTEGKPKQMY